jgi:hypothetical protein
MIQYEVLHRTNNMTDIVTQAAATSYLLIYSGAVPANCAASATGTLLASLACSSTFGTVASGVLTANAITNASATSGTAGYWRLCTSSAGTTCVAQGLCFASSTLSTNGATTIGSILPFASTTGVSAGQTVTGTNIPAGTYVLSVTSTTVTLNQNISGTVASGATITFGGDLTFTGGVTFTTGQIISVSNFTLTATGA